MSTINRHAAAILRLKPAVMIFLRYILKRSLPKSANLEHLFWALSFFSCYEVEEAGASRLEFNEKNRQK